MSNTPDRLIELANRAAQDEHDWYFDGSVTMLPPKDKAGHSQPFETCTQVDCALIRDVESAQGAAMGRLPALEALQLHRCKICGTRWLLWPDMIHGGGWNLLDRYQRPGACCDNVAMGEQIEHLRDLPLAGLRADPGDWRDGKLIASPMAWCSFLKGHTGRHSWEPDPGGSR